MVAGREVGAVGTGVRGGPYSGAARESNLAPCVRWVMKRSLVVADEVDVKEPNALRGCHPWLDNVLNDLAFFGSHLSSAGCLPGNGGDVSVLLPAEVQEALCRNGTDNWPEFRFDRIPDLASYRRDRGPYYRAEPINPQLLRDAGGAALEDRAILATVSGGKIWDIGRRPERHLCVVLVTRACESFKLYGTDAHGTVPTTEFVNHLMAHAANLRAGYQHSAVIHAHPQALIDLSRHARGENFRGLNRTLYGQRPELVANVPDLVGLIPFQAPGSGSLVEATIHALAMHRLILWARHGVLARESSLERCVDLLEYAETSAAAALRDATLGNALRSFSGEELASFVSMYGLPRHIEQVFATE
jgi:rhamnulose-1-phosphate aldolase